MTKDVKLLWTVLYFSCFDLSSFCVRVTLENGQTGRARKSVSLGATATLVCLLSGPGTVEWNYRASQADGTILLIVKDSEVSSGFLHRFELQRLTNLVLKKVERTDAGTYECRGTAENDPQLGDGTYNVTVLIPPSKPVCGYPKNHRLILYEKAQITCRSDDGIPTPLYTWFRNSTILPEKSQPQYPNTSFNRHTGTLTFPNVTEADAGTYYCLSLNTAGSEKCDAANLTAGLDVSVSEDSDLTSPSQKHIIWIVSGCVFGVILISLLVYLTWNCGPRDDSSRKSRSNISTNKMPLMSSHSHSKNTSRSIRSTKSKPTTAIAKPSYSDHPKEQFSGLYEQAFTPNDEFSDKKVMPTTEQASKPYNKEFEYLPGLYAA